jgi:hypothetical protein
MLYNLVDAVRNGWAAFRGAGKRDCFEKEEALA